MGVLRPFPDPLSPPVLVWIAVAAAAIGLAFARGPIRQRRRVVGALALFAVFTTSAVKVNAFYGYRPTLAGVLGLPAANEIDIADVSHPAALFTAPAATPMSAVWHSPRDMPAGGRTTQVDIPGRVAGTARPAGLYLPPAYLASPRPRLPVLVMVPGQPGGPEDCSSPVTSRRSWTASPRRTTGSRRSWSSPTRQGRRGVTLCAWTPGSAPPKPTSPWTSRSG